MRPILNLLFPPDVILSEYVSGMKKVYGENHTLASINTYIAGHYNALIETVKEYDGITGTHLRSTETISAYIAKQMQLPMSDVIGVTLGAALHDIGKIGVRYEIITKPGKLTDEERTEVEQHTVIGKRILESLITPWELQQYPYMHHERLDGSGYPNKLTADQIPTTIKILCVADFIDAVTANRPYRKGWNFTATLDYLNDHYGQFDKDIIKIAETFDFSIYNNIT